MNKAVYNDLLKHPKWQKKRLEILNRDKFTCLQCGRGIKDGTTLNVHHLKYIKDRNPWEYDNSNFITLCEDCHSLIHKKPYSKNKKGNILYKGLLSCYELSASEKIIVSFILSHSDYNNISQTYIAKSLNLNRASVCRFFKKNIDLSKYEWCKNRGFFFLVENKNLKGVLLIFFSWLIDLKKDKPAIYAKREKIASMYNKPLEYIRDYLQRLRKLGLIERGKNLELIIK